LIRVTRMWGN
jgi:alkylated DNA repair dioxygenase AlkB